MSIELKTGFPIWLPMAALACAACGSSAVERRVILSTEAGSSNDEGDGDGDEASVRGQATVVEPNSPLEKRMLADERGAAEILSAEMCKDAKDASAWAGIHALRLGIRHDEACAAQAMDLGVRSGDVLVRALSWRRLAAWTSAELPRTPLEPSEDPVVRVMAALAHAGRGEIPRELLGALALPAGEASGKDRKDEIDARCVHLTALSSPFDDGLLALAVAFVEARREETSETGPDGRPVWSAARLRAKLASSLGLETNDFLKTEEAQGEDAVLNSEVSERLDNRLAARPPDIVRRIAVAGPEPLRIEALRAIAVSVFSPAAGDLGAAAAAMASPSPALRVEGARTFLLLFLRLKR